MLHQASGALDSSDALKFVVGLKYRLEWPNRCQVTEGYIFVFMFCHIHRCARLKCLLFSYCVHDANLAEFPSSVLMFLELLVS
jgi:hypothetical protein